MREYYFLGAFLPSIKWKETPSVTFQEMALLLEENLSEKDLAYFETFRLLYDLENIRAFWTKEPFDPIGKLKEKEMEEALQKEIYFPLYVFDFLNSKDSLRNRLHSFPELISLYFSTEIPKAAGFFKKYLEFERALRLVLVALRSKTLGRDLLGELQYEDPDEELVADILSQKDARDFIPPDEFLGLKEIYQKNLENPLEFFEALCKYRFEWIENAIKGTAFSWDRVLGEIIKLMLIERWAGLDQARGIHLLKEAL